MSLPLKTFLTLLVSGFLLTGSFAVVQADPVTDGLNSIQANANLPNPTYLKNKSVTDILVAVIKILLEAAFGVALLFVIIGGYMYITSAGSEEQATKGRQTLVYALIGVAIIILSYVIVNVFSNLVLTGNIGN